MYIWQHVYDLYSYENEHIWFTTILKYVLPLFFFFILNFFFYQGFLSQTLTIHSAAGEGGEGRGGEHLYSSLPIPPVHEHSDIYLQLCMWDDYHVFSIASLVTTRLILSEIYLPSYWTTIWLIDDGILISFCLLDDLV